MLKCYYNLTFKMYIFKYYKMLLIAVMGKLNCHHLLFHVHLNILTWCPKKYFKQSCVKCLCKL